MQIIEKISSQSIEPITASLETVIEMMAKNKIVHFHSGTPYEGAQFTALLKYQKRMHELKTSHYSAGELHRTGV